MLLNQDQFKTILPCLLCAALLLTIAAGCSATSDRWTGTVDAVFRYRTQETSTVIFEVRPGTFSEEVGLKPGDLLLAIDGNDITSATYQSVRAALRGPVGSIAKLTVKRGDEILEFEIERRPAKSDNKAEGDN